MKMVFHELEVLFGDGVLRKFRAIVCDLVELCLVGSSLHPSQRHEEYDAVRATRYLFRTSEDWRVLVHEIQPVVYGNPFRRLVGNESDAELLVFLFHLDDLSERTLHRNAYAAVLLAEGEEKSVESLVV